MIFMFGRTLAKPLPGAILSQGHTMHTIQFHISAGQGLPCYHSALPLDWIMDMTIGEIDNLQPRHRRVLEFLANNAPKHYSIPQLSAKLDISRHTLGNELPKLNLSGHVLREAQGRTFYYYLPKQAKLKPHTKGEPLTKGEFGSLVEAIATPDYEPKVNKLAWKLPWAIAHLTNAGLSGDLTHQHAAHTALEELLEATEAAARALRRLLSTPQLWTAHLSAWLTEGISEKDLEIVGEITRQALDLHGRLETSKQTDKETLNDHR